MFERLRKPFVTTMTGEAYQPIRFVYSIHDKEALIISLNQLDCVKKAEDENVWHWHWTGACDHLEFQSISHFKRNAKQPVKLGRFVIEGQQLYLEMPSFKRACLAAPFFHRAISPNIAVIHYADFVNKIFSLEEGKTPHSFSEYFHEEELSRLLRERQGAYEKIQVACDASDSTDKAWEIMSDYASEEVNKPLPPVERYEFAAKNFKERESDVIFLGFYIFLRGRELVAIKQWMGEAGYTIGHAMDEVSDSVFGYVDVDKM